MSSDKKKSTVVVIRINDYPRRRHYILCFHTHTNTRVHIYIYDFRDLSPYSCPFLKTTATYNTCNVQ